jgi:membrane protease YdiL (CAAX protease family)
MNFETSENFEKIIIICEYLFILGGLYLLFLWSLKTHFGKYALSESAIRRTNLNPLVPLGILIVLYLGIFAAGELKDKIFSGLEKWQQVLTDNLLICLCTIVAIIAVGVIADKTFARRLRGFGFKWETIGKDFGMAIVNLYTVWPLIYGSFWISIYVGKLIYGPEFEMSKHEQLEVLTQYPQLSVKIATITAAAVIAPIFEEMLFRGMFQSIIRSFVFNPWLAIILTSIFFASIHANAGHWPTLFILSVSLGYAYEKSGSILRPIFMHFIFNTTSLVATLYFS